MQRLYELLPLLYPSHAFAMCTAQTVKAIASTAPTAAQTSPAMACPRPTCFHLDSLSPMAPKMIASTTSTASSNEVKQKTIDRMPSTRLVMARPLLPPPGCG